MANSVMPALPVDPQQVMSPSAHEVAAAMTGAASSTYGATVPGPPMISVANGAAALTGTLTTSDATRRATRTPAQRADDLVASLAGNEGLFQPDLAMPSRHPELADDGRTGPEQQVLLHQGAQMVPHGSIAASPPQQLFATAAQDASVVELQGIHQETTGHVQVAGGSSQLPVVRWVSRLTEFLRTTAARGASNMDRVMEDMGMTPILPSRISPAPQGSVSVASQRAVLSGQGRQTMEISPPEEMMSGLAIPATWAQARSPARASLFEAGELDQLRRVQARSSLLVGPSSAPMPPSDGNSTSSSTNLQAEVQRQLEEYGQRQRVEMQRLQQEIFNLRAERDALQEGRRLSGLEQGGGVVQTSTTTSAPTCRRSSCRSTWTFSSSCSPKTIWC